MTGPPARLRAWLDARSAEATRSWRGTDALRRSMLLGPALVVAGLLAHHSELVLFGAPLLVSGMLAIAARPHGQPAVTLRPVPRSVESGQRARLLVDIDPGTGAELTAIRLPRPGRPGPGRVHLLPAEARTIGTALRWDAWGETVDTRPDHLVAGADGLLIHGPVLGREGLRTVLPPVRPLPPGPLPPRIAGLVGAHRSPRPGDSTELRDIRPFQPGDRLRRVDWRVSLRVGARTDTGEGLLTSLHIRERHAEADASVLLAVDTRIDVGHDLGEWSEAAQGASVRVGGSLDTAVTAAVSLAATYLRAGDRVGLVDLGRPQLSVPVGTGRRQLLRLRQQLVICARSAGWSSRPVLRPEQVPPGALVVVLSPFLDDAVLRTTVHAARRGSLVLAVDVLPSPLRVEVDRRDNPWGESVRQIIVAEHDLRLAALRARGVAVLGWGDGTGLAGVLRRSRPRNRPVAR
ncbi:MAG TPA: DUF58 domain-containing protein [Pseudonocardiaceae bacterium]|nr:DUF58 domain-containing protein [Pseudonocardiaceae bacterium]